MFIDGDTHIDETEDTWSYVPSDLVPRTLHLSHDEVPPWLIPITGASSDHNRMWYLDGQLHSRRVRNDARTGTTAETRELIDVPGRLRDMDDLGIEMQVIYPTLLLGEVTRRSDVDVALCSSYNRWLSERCDQSSGRLRWLARLPYTSIPDAEKELRLAKERGAVGFVKKGVECDRSASDPYFFPIYQLAEELDLAICIHSSVPWSPEAAALSRVRPVYTLGFTGVTVLQAFYALVADKVPQKFPRARFGFVEAGSTWLPYLMQTLQITNSQSFLRDNRLFVTCEVSEDLTYLVKWFGDESLFVGTDYCHGDRASVLNAHGAVVSNNTLSEETKERITRLNAAEFYGLG